MSGSGVASDTARRLDSSAAANPPANPEKGISHLRPLPQSWRKKARESAAAETPKAAHAGHSPSTAGLEAPTPGSRDGQKAAVQPAAEASSPTGEEIRSQELSKLAAADPFAPASGAVPVSTGCVQHAAAAMRLDAHDPAGGVQPTTFGASPVSAVPAPITSSPRSPHAIKPYSARGTTLATIVEPIACSAAVNFLDDMPVVPIPLVSAGQATYGQRTFANSLSLIIEALSFNQMTLGGGFDAFDIDGDGRISRQDFQRSVDDLQLELDEHTIQLMHRCLDADDDGFIGRQVSCCDVLLHTAPRRCRSAHCIRREYL